MHKSSLETKVCNGYMETGLVILELAAKQELEPEELELTLRNETTGESFTISLKALFAAAGQELLKNF